MNVDVDEGDLAEGLSAQSMPAARKSGALTVLQCIAGFWVLVGLAFAFCCWWIFPPGLPFGDGHFHGTPVSPITGREPDQVVGIWRGKSLQVFDATDDSGSPIVQLCRHDGTIQWSVQADGQSSGDVRSLRFDHVRRGWFRSGIVHGTVEWTFGREKARWIITGSGELRDYWYSW